MDSSHRLSLSITVPLSFLSWASSASIPFTQPHSLVVRAEGATVAYYTIEMNCYAMYFVVVMSWLPSLLPPYLSPLVMQDSLLKGRLLISKAQSQRKGLILYLSVFKRWNCFIPDIMEHTDIVS